MKKPELHNAWMWVLLAALPPCGAGCALHRHKLDETLDRVTSGAVHQEAVRASYRIDSPDRLQITASTPDPWSIEQTVTINGSVKIPSAGSVEVVDATPAEAGKRIARKLGVSPDLVDVQVLDYRSRKLFVHGEVVGLQKVIPYQGPETVLEVIKRAGGITSGAAPGEIQLVRAHIADGKSPEVFEINLQEILVQRKPESNIIVEPFDQIYIAQSRSCVVSKCMPPIVKPFWNWILGLTRANKKKEPHVGGLPGLNPQPTRNREL